MSDDRASGCGVVFGLLTLCVLPFRSCFVEPRRALDAMDASGFTESKIVDRDDWFVAWSGCGASDVVAFTVQAKNPAGKPTHMLACVGWPLRGVTLRFP